MEITSENKNNPTFSMKKVARPTEISDEMLTERKSIFSKLRISGAALAQKVIIAVGNGMISARCPEK